MNIKDSKIYIAGHNGMVGSSILRVLKSYGYKNIIGLSRDKLNLINQDEVIDFF
jgi:GDP-L-fucose synthase